MPGRAYIVCILLIFGYLFFAHNELVFVIIWLWLSLAIVRVGLSLYCRPGGTAHQYYEDCHCCYTSVLSTPVTGVKAAVDRLAVCLNINATHGWGPAGSDSTHPRQKWLGFESATATIWHRRDPHSVHRGQGLRDRSWSRGCYWQSVSRRFRRDTASSGTLSIDFDSLISFCAVFLWAD